MKVKPVVIMLVMLFGAALIGCESKEPSSTGQQTEQTMEQAPAAEQAGGKSEEAGEKTDK